MAKFCTNCGAKLEGDFEFCTECGSNLNAPAKPNGVVIRNFVGENDNIKVIDEKGPFKVIEYEKWMSGSSKLSTGIKGVADLGKKFLKSTVTNETTVKPEYSGNGYVITEQTYKHLILLDLNDWGNNLMIDDGLFLAAEKTVELSVKRRTNLSSAFASSEGFFNTVLHGNGYICLESRIPLKELIIIELNNDTVSIDGPMAIAWTSNLELTVERSAKSFMGSAVSGEGLVNVYRGTGKILMAPLTGNLKLRDMPKSDK